MFGIVASDSKHAYMNVYLVLSLSPNNHKQLIVVTFNARHEFWWSLIRIMSHPDAMYILQATTDAEQGGGEGEGRKGEEKESAEKKQKDPSTFNLVEAAQYGVLER